jgi:hypothetical protein
MLPFFQCSLFEERIMQEKTYELHTSVCEKCGELRVRFPVIEILPGLYAQAAPNKLCKCEREKVEKDFADLQEKLKVIDTKIAKHYRLEEWGQNEQGTQSYVCQKCGEEVKYRPRVGVGSGVFHPEVFVQQCKCMKEKQEELVEKMRKLSGEKFTEVK